MSWHLTEALAAHARDTPDAVAVVGPDGRLSYRALYEQASAAAAGLRARDAGPGVNVAFDAQRTAGAVSTLIAILLTGAAYVPVDPGAPASRRRLLVADCASPLFVAAASRGDLLAADELPAPVVPFERLLAEGSGTRAAHAAPVEDDDAYVIYTSGSTGRPKGVRVQHRALATFLGAAAPVLRLDSRSVCLNTTGLHFDASIADVLLPLVLGAHVHLGPSMLLPSILLHALEQERVTHMTAVGSTLTMLARHGHGLDGRDLVALRTVLTGAEIINPGTVQAWLHAAPNLTVINGYGPTEATCAISFEPITEREPGRTEPYPIGPPLPTVKVRFVSEGCGITADGPGEMLIGGPQLMRGYLRRPDETAAAFLDVDGEQFYRTGDVARRREDGVLLFDGRRDDEVKVNGYRVNLNEVRQAFEAHPRVSHAFVALAPDPRLGQSLECAVLLKGLPIGEAALVEPDAALFRLLEEHASRMLPKYMVPRRLHQLTALPVLASGKPDRQAVTGLMASARDAVPAASSSPA